MKYTGLFPAAVVASVAVEADDEVAASFFVEAIVVDGGISAVVGDWTEISSTSESYKYKINCLNKILLIINVKYLKFNMKIF